MIMKTFDVTFTRYGFAIIEAENEDKAYEIAESMCDEDITWSDDYEVTDCNEDE